MARFRSCGKPWRDYNITYIKEELYPTTRLVPPSHAYDKERVYGTVYEKPRRWSCVNRSITDGRHKGYPTTHTANNHEYPYCGGTKRRFVILGDLESDPKGRRKRIKKRKIYVQVKPLYSVPLYNVTLLITLDRGMSLPIIIAGIASLYNVHLYLTYPPIT